MAEVFISYTSEDLAHCEFIGQKLTTLGVSVWYDKQLEVRSLWTSSIRLEIKIAKCVLVLLSHSSIKNKWVERETIEADMPHNEGKLIGVYLEKLRAEDIPMQFHDTQCASLIDFDGKDDHIGWLKLIECIEKFTKRNGLRRFCELLACGDVNGAAQWARNHYEDPLARRAVDCVTGLLRKETLDYIDLMTARQNPKDLNLGKTGEMNRGEEENWEAIKDSKDYRDFVDHLERWRDGLYSIECREKILKLSR